MGYKKQVRVAAAAQLLLCAAFFAAPAHAVTYRTLIAPTGSYASDYLGSSVWARAT